MGNKLEYIREARAKYDSYDMSVWEKAYFDEYSGGFCIYHKKHQFATTDGGGEAEKTVGLLLAKFNGKQVEFLSEGIRKKSDLKFDEQTWEIKYIRNANIKTIRGYIEEIRKKKSDNGIFYWGNAEKLDFLRSAIASESGKMFKLGRINEMPNIYYIDKHCILKLLWKK